jgi:hypothetical protein
VKQIDWIPVDLNLLPAQQWQQAIHDVRLATAMMEEAVKFLPAGVDDCPSQQ